MSTCRKHGWPERGGTYADPTPPCPWCQMADLRKRIAELDAVAEKYRELLYQVACKFPNETRHETALRYLKERESRKMAEEQCAAALLGGGE